MTQPKQEHPFAQFVRILGKGKTGTRDLTRAEAQLAFGMVLRGEAEDLQIGAFLMLLRVKEESAEEIVGFVEACRNAMVPPPAELVADIDWASYAGKKHQHPWYILAMLLLAREGHRVLVHGSGGHTPGRLYTEQAMRALSLPIAENWDDASNALDSRSLCYIGLSKFCPVLEDIMQMRPLLGLRSPVNTLARLLNPLAAAHSIQSIFHPSYARVHRLADRALGQPASLVYKGESGEAEVKPQADTRLFYLHQGQDSEWTMQRSIEQRVKPVAEPLVAPLRSLWAGNSNDAYGLQATLATTAAALHMLHPHENFDRATERATDLWHARDKHGLP